MLDATKAEIKPREALRVNPAKTCQPVGAMYAALGIHGCMPHSHGSQGCCAYHRSHLTRHYKEPVVATTSSFTEGASVFGGLANLTQALNNIFAVYNPDVVAIHTTCLSEVIGDDIPTIVRKAADEGYIPKGKHIIHANTPSFVGSHITGFANMTTAMVKYLAERTYCSRNQLNIIPGFVDASDMREIKRITKEMGIKTVLFPDTSDVLDQPQTGKYHMYPKGGVTVDALKTTGDSLATIALGHMASHQAAIELDEKCSVPCAFLDLPIGLSHTDRFVHALHNYAGVDVPESLVWERGRLIDAMGDMHQYIFGKRVAIAGDPDHVISLVQFLVDLEMKPTLVITGSPGQHFDARIQEITKDSVPSVQVKSNSDLFQLHQWIKNTPIDLLIGNSYCKHIARAENLPFVRFGWPIMDRMSHRLFPTTGYTGAMRLLDKIVDAFLDKADRECPDEFMELVQ